VLTVPKIADKGTPHTGQFRWDHATLGGVNIDLDPATRPTLTVDEVAIVMGIARSSAFAAVKAGEIPSFRVGRRLLVPTAALRRMLALDGAPNAAA
jgi:excisionase family DNA binding protein